MNMQVKEISDKASVSTDVVRYYTRIGLLKPQRCETNGYKLYSEKDLTLLRFILRAKSLGFTLSEIQEIMDHADDGKSPCPMVREILVQRIHDNRKKLDALVELQNRMELAIKKWVEMPDQLPDGDSVCHLIESVGE